MEGEQGQLWEGTCSGSQEASWGLSSRRGSRLSTGPDVLSLVLWLSFRAIRNLLLLEAEQRGQLTK